MKKFITVAALVAAGTALASAAGWEQVELTSTEVQSGTATLADLGMSGSYAYDEYSWVVSFTLGNISTDNHGAAVFTTNTSSTTGGTGLDVLVNTGKGFVNIADPNGNHIGDPNMSGSDDSALNGTDDLTFYFYWDAVNTSAYLYTVQSGSTIWTTTLTDPADHLNDLSDASLDASKAAFSATTAVGGNAETTLPITGIAVYVSSVSDVPEPSMFGVLAGLGALALVSTRRRRNRKA